MYLEFYLIITDILDREIDYDINSTLFSRIYSMLFSHIYSLILIDYNIHN